MLIVLIAFIWEAMRSVNWKMKSPFKESSGDLLCLLNRVCACAHLWMFIILPRTPHRDYVCNVPSVDMSLEGGHSAVCCPQEGEVAGAP